MSKRGRQRNDLVLWGGNINPINHFPLFSLMMLLETSVALLGVLGATGACKRSKSCILPS